MSQVHRYSCWEVTIFCTIPPKLYRVCHVPLVLDYHVVLWDYLQTVSVLTFLSVNGHVFIRKSHLLITETMKVCQSCFSQIELVLTSIQSFNCQICYHEHSQQKSKSKSYTHPMREQKDSMCQCMSSKNTPKSEYQLLVMYSLQLKYQPKIIENSSLYPVLNSK